MTPICVSAWVIHHSEQQKVTLKVLVNGVDRFLLVETIVPWPDENVYLHITPRQLSEFMNRLPYCFLTLKEHGVKVKDGTLAFHLEASKFCEPLGKSVLNFLGFDGIDGK
jgi:hypothetical protein